MFEENHGVRREEDFQHLLPCGPSVLRVCASPSLANVDFPLVVHLGGLWWQWDLEVPSTCILF